MKNSIQLFSPMFVVFLLAVLPVAYGQQAFDSEPVTLQPVTSDIEAVVANDMAGCPAGGSTEHAGINKNGVYTLTGDLFGIGTIYGIIDNGENAIVCQWSDTKWKATTVINVDVEWKGSLRPSGRGSEEGKPFWTLPFEGYSLLVIGSVVEKEGQYYYVILFDPATNSIKAVASSFSIRPQVALGYLIVTDSSRVKSEWKGTYFCKPQSNQFVMEKGWEESVPYNHPDNSSNTAIINHTSYSITEDVGVDDGTETFEIVKEYIDSNISQRNDTGGGKGKAFARVSFIPRKSKNYNYSSFDGQLPYLFEKLLDLPRSLYPEDSYDPIPMGHAESLFKIKVSGNPEAIKLLSPRTSK